MIVLDANILIRAVLGRRVRQRIDTYAGQCVRFFAPELPMRRRHTDTKNRATASNGLKRSRYFLDLRHVNQFSQGRIDGTLVREMLSHVR
jgi:hypothetical protein